MVFFFFDATFARALCMRHGWEFEWMSEDDACDDAMMSCFFLVFLKTNYLTVLGGFSFGNLSQPLGLKKVVQIISNNPPLPRASQNFPTR